MLPGIGNSGPQHWQSLWERRQAWLQRVEQSDWDNPACADWVATLQRAIAAEPLPIVLVAHSLGCLLAAHWAAGVGAGAGAGARGAVLGALLVAPPDPQGPAFPPQARGFTPLPLDPLPFPSILVCSSNDPYCSPGRAEAFSRAWNSRIVHVGAQGHVNASSGLGEWSEGFELLRDLTR